MSIHWHLLLSRTRGKFFNEILKLNKHDINRADSLYGNNILHVAVLHDLVDVYKFVKNLWKEQEAEEREKKERGEAN